MKTRTHAAIGQRIVLAMTCWVCGVFKPGDEFERRARARHDDRPYIDRRCRGCRWTHMEAKRSHLGGTV